MLTVTYYTEVDGVEYTVHAELSRGSRATLERPAEYAEVEDMTLTAPDGTDATHMLMDSRLFESLCAEAFERAAEQY